jgi:murein tripeptide amidase MpaA
MDSDASSPIKVDTAFDISAAAKERESILIDAAHHARELTGISEVFYAMVRVLHGYLHNDAQVRSWLGHNGFYFIPVVNWDSVKLISEQWDKTG